MLCRFRRVDRIRACGNDALGGAHDVLSARRPSGLRRRRGGGPARTSDGAPPSASRVRAPSRDTTAAATPIPSTVATIANGTARSGSFTATTAMAEHTICAPYATSATSRPLRPIAANRCDEWSVPPSITGRPSRRRSQITRIVSNTGTPRIRAWTPIRSTSFDTSRSSSRPSDASRNPSRSDPASPEEDPSGREVVTQEPEAGAGEGDRERGDEVVALRRRDREVREARDRGDPRREPVHVVGQVDRVRDHDHPSDREQQVERAGCRRSRRAPHPPRAAPRARPRP